MSTVCTEHTWVPVHLIANIKRCSVCRAWLYKDTETGAVGVGDSITDACQQVADAKPEGTPASGREGDGDE